MHAYVEKMYVKVHVKKTENLMRGLCRGPNTAERRALINISWDLTPKKWIREVRIPLN
jgi:hypothetical protein